MKTKQSINTHQHVPQHLKHVREFKDTNLVIDDILDPVIDDISEIDNQFLLETSTWYLDIIEFELGINNKHLPSDRRVEIIKSRLRGRGTTTVEMIKRTAESFINGEVDVHEEYDKYNVIIEFIGEYGRPEGLKNFSIMIRNILPAHLTFSYRFSYMTWQEFDDYNKTWNEWDIKGLTWEEFEKYKE